MEVAGVQQHWTNAIREWAGRQPLVIEVYAFGSRVKGGYRPDSDLDLAFVIDGQDEGETLGNAIFLLPSWRNELQAMLPVEVHAQPMFDDDEVVAPAVRDHGMLLFRRFKLP
ncbi:nucleotidyltransferase domain-containing protein [Glacieibacterium megasporae]|uniref:nucleotidyltransferase domain-containing protein n=1 Tax=Glacieibacterium megasporae TaxID=2835787 RepID=UPI001C1DE27E|nr:nucleotidyltransferase domain-containing protein [Polymorphobacter megasporae]UAJ10641.1 nucleotidyltransferase domain-containing protein [Polymorphobacter megasporae]